jgi:hypothetical protein
VRIQYYIENFSDQEFDCLWSAHPLLKVDPGDRIFVHEPVNKLFLNWASDEQIGHFGDTIEWPCISLNGTVTDYSVIKERSEGIAMKCFTGPVHNGEAAVYYTLSNESLIYAFNPEQTPYLGIWLCYGGWPTDQDYKHLTVALEPASGRPDSLEEAITRHECSSIGPKSKKEWHLNIQIKKGHPDWVEIN